MVCGLLALAACGTKTPVPPAKEPAVRLTAGATIVHWIDSVTFVAHIRPDVAAQLRPADHPGDPMDLAPHIIGWHWVPDLDWIDQWTQTCPGPGLTCTIMVHGGGTMVFSVRLRDQVCADWVHVEARSVPDVDETDSIPRLRADSVDAAIRTKTPTWARCTV